MSPVDEAETNCGRPAVHGIVLRWPQAIIHRMSRGCLFNSLIPEPSALPLLFPPFYAIKRIAGYPFLKKAGKNWRHVAHKQENKAMSAAVRINHLEINGPAVRTLEKAERHGKRQDFTSQSRKVREADPLVFGGIDLMALYERHMKGVRLNKGAKKPVMHAICQWPTNIPVNAETEASMLKYAVEFMNSRLGGNAVFAARLDRDEGGRHTVDVFATPIYEKVTKKGTARWASTSKHLKALCVKHSAEIIERKKGKFTDNLSAQGIALQSEWREHLIENGLELAPKRPKATSAPDRLEPEAYKLREDRKKLDAYRQKLSDYEYELAKYRDSLYETAYELGVELPPDFDDEITLDLPPTLPPEPEPEDDYRP